MVQWLGGMSSQQPGMVAPLRLLEAKHRRRLQRHRALREQRAGSLICSAPTTMREAVSRTLGAFWRLQSRLPHDRWPQRRRRRRVTGSLSKRGCLGESGRGTRKWRQARRHREPLQLRRGLHRGGIRRRQVSWGLRPAVRGMSRPCVVARLPPVARWGLGGRRRAPLSGRPAAPERRAHMRSVRVRLSKAALGVAAAATV